MLAIDLNDFFEIHKSIIKSGKTKEIIFQMT